MNDDIRRLNVASRRSRQPHAIASRSPEPNRRWNAASGVTACVLVMLGLMAVGAVSAGCSRQTFDIAEVSGTVTLGDRPLPGVMVQFQPQVEEVGKYPAAFGFTDAEGRYTLVRSGGKSGAVVGAHEVRILPQEREEQPATPLPDGLADRVFEFEVRPGRNVIDIRVDADPRPSGS
jgi:hypothetical protein